MILCHLIITLVSRALLGLCHLIITFVSRALLGFCHFISTWCSVPNHYFRKKGGLNFLLKCNYDTKYFPQLPAFYKNILKFFQELKILYGYDQESDVVLYNNKEILVVLGFFFS